MQEYLFTLAKRKQIETKLGTLISLSYFKENLSKDKYRITSCLCDAMIFNGFGSAITFMAENQLHDFEIKPLEDKNIPKGFHIHLLEEITKS